MAKKVCRKFGGFKKSLYLCTRNSKERVFGGVWRSLSGEQVLVGRVVLGRSYIIGVRRTGEALEKKLLRIFGGFEKLLYLCVRNSKERGFRASSVIRLVGSV